MSTLKHYTTKLSKVKDHGLKSFPVTRGNVSHCSAMLPVKLEFKDMLTETLLHSLPLLFVHRIIRVCYWLH